MIAHDEFKCPTCGAMVYSVPPRDPPPTHCFTCQWLIDSVSDLDERDAIRKRIDENES